MSKLLKILHRFRVAGGEGHTIGCIDSMITLPFPPLRSEQRQNNISMQMDAETLSLGAISVGLRS